MNNNNDKIILMNILDTLGDIVQTNKRYKFAIDDKDNEINMLRRKMRQQPIPPTQQLSMQQPSVQLSSPPTSQPLSSCPQVYESCERPNSNCPPCPAPVVCQYKINRKEKQYSVNANPINVDLKIEKSTQSGGTKAEDIISNIDYKPNQIIKLSSQNENYKFIMNNDKNVKIYSGNYFFARGMYTAVYMIVAENLIDRENLINKDLILRVTLESTTDLVDKYRNDIELLDMKKYIVDILFYGLLHVSNNIRYHYAIVPIYSTSKIFNIQVPGYADMNVGEKLKVEYDTYYNKLNFTKSVINMLQTSRLNNVVLNDMKLDNISATEDGECVIIDYDISTIGNDISQRNMYRVSFAPVGTSGSNPVMDKYYHNFLGEIIYKLFFNEEYMKDWRNTFYKLHHHKLELKDDIEWIDDYLWMLERSRYDGVDKLLLKDNKGLMKNQLDDILSLDEVKKYLNYITIKPKQAYRIDDTAKNMILGFLGGVINPEFEFGLCMLCRKDYLNKNYTQFDTIVTYDKIPTIQYYLKYNDWSIVEYKNDSDDKIVDKTLQYALQSVGCIMTVELMKKYPVFKLHINREFLFMYGGIFDNCRKIEYDIVPLIYWIQNITDMFNIYYIKYRDTFVNNKRIYINVLDHPLIRQDGDHPFEIFRSGNIQTKIPITVRPDVPIYSWIGKVGYDDIPLPFHDIWMFLFGIDFSHKFNINTWRTQLIPFNRKTIKKAVFRGGYTNCTMNIVDSPRVLAHIKSLQYPETIDAGIVTGNWKYTNYMCGQLDAKNDPNFLSKNFLTQSEQLQYRYILNLDGFGSPFRIIQELYYDSCIIIANSEFIDVIREILVPWKHYIPCNGDLSNLNNTVLWCRKNERLIDTIIMPNMRTLRDAIVNIDTMFELLHNRLTGNINDTLADTAHFNIQNQQTIDPIPNIQNDDEKYLRQNVSLVFKTIDGNIVQEEDITY